MTRLPRLTCLIATLAALGAGCEEETAQPLWMTCDGQLFPGPTVVAALPGGVHPYGPRGLVTRGTTAYVLSNDSSGTVGTVTAVDLCSRTTSTLASFTRVGGAVIVDDSMLLGVDRGAGGEIVRLPLDGGDIETVAVTPGPVPALESVEGKIIVATADGSGGVDFYELSGSELVRFGGASPLSDPLHGTGTVNVVGASESGVYVRRSQPGGDQPLLLVRFDGAPHGPVISTREPLLTLAVWAGRLIVITPGHILSLAPWGGETETLLDQGNATSLVHSIAVDEHSICWASGSDKNDGAPRCMPQGGGEVRAFGNARATALELTDGVLVWTVTSAEGTKVLAAIP